MTQHSQNGEEVEVIRAAWEMLCARLQRDPATSEEGDTCTLRAAMKAMVAFAGAAREPATADVGRAIDSALADYVRACEQRSQDPAFSEVSAVVVPAVIAALSRAAPSSGHAKGGGWSLIGEGDRSVPLLVGCWVESEGEPQRWSAWTVWPDESLGCDGAWGDPPTHCQPLPSPPDATTPKPSPTPKGGLPGRGETWASIATWCEETFGPCTPYRMATRAGEELAELIEESQALSWSDKARIEAADVLICLSRVPGLWDAVEEKMAINRDRIWDVQGDGTGYHAKQLAPAEAIRDGGEGGEG